MDFFITKFRVYSVYFCLLLILGCGSGNDGFRIVNHTPSGGNVRVDSAITVQFSQDINQATLTSGSFWLSDGHEKVRAELSYNSATRTATLKPAKLYYETLYTMSVDHSITNTNGEHLGDNARDWTFNTEDRVPIFTHQPEPGAQNVSVNSKVRLEFEYPPENASVNQQNFFISLNSVPVQGSIDIRDHVAEFTPAQPWQPGATYTVNLSTNIRRSTNEPMFATPHTWSFTVTTQPTSTKHFGSADDESIADAVLGSDGNIYIGGSKTPIDLPVGMPNAPSIGIFPPNIGPPDTQSYIAKMDMNGTTLWEKTFGANNYDTVTALALTSASEIVATGQSDNLMPQLDTPQTISNIFVTKYDTNGNQLWEQQFGATDKHAMVAGVALDEQNNIYLAGSTMGAVAGFTNAGEHDLLFAKYDTNGQQILLTQKGTENDEVAMGIVYSANTLYVVVSEQKAMDMGSGMGGQFHITNPSANIRLFRFDSNGTELGQNEYIFNGHVEVSRPMISAAGELYMPGMVHGGFDSSGTDTSGGFLLKTDGNGQELWRRQWASTGGKQVETHLVYLDDAQSIYVAGIEVNFDPIMSMPVFGPGQAPRPEMPTSNLQIRKLDQNAEQPLWTSEIPVNGHANFAALLPTPSGELIGIGSAHGGVDGNSSIGGSDGFILRVDSAGVVR
ncbi:MAG: Ig-like domain-containing protein [Gammaproteobacteria bacterium]|nr:Ig-like domain-containing protein [Gammaproteobacteria bacterium]